MNRRRDLWLGPAKERPYHSAYCPERAAASPGTQRMPEPAATRTSLNTSVPNFVRAGKRDNLSPIDSAMEAPKPRLGEPAPWFECRSPVNPRFHFDTVAGRYIVLCFFGSTGNETARTTLDAFRSRRESFDDTDCCFFGVSVDRAGQYSVRINDQWRLCFRWGSGDAFDVEITDYH
ncbi:MAG TPA: hypothetical protein VMM76_23790 [Pirellulaceae bacterium]|nr:hypothetical protein [Pirellulaceae bacterium]